MTRRRRPRWYAAEARDIAQHVVTMRRCVLELAHMRFHGAMFIGTNPFAEGYARNGVALTKHFKVSWLPFGLSAVALKGFNRRMVFDVCNRIVERRGPCPLLHDYAAEGLDDAERAANGEVL